MGIPQEYFEQKMHAIPTDMQFRVLLCQALFGDPQALLLDEPTNHLDLESIGWLETFLHEYKGTLIVISHDRHFLNSVTTHIADIDYETIIIYPGNYDEMMVAKTAVRERAEAGTRQKKKKSPNSGIRRKIRRRYPRKPSAVPHPRNRAPAAARTEKIKYPAPLYPLYPHRKSAGPNRLKNEDIAKGYGDRSHQGFLLRNTARR